ncbi:DNA topoisomerase IB [Deminuibacter soli]|uniref:DNA topoisomerase n=1 Tax=Deminuibacter soli TaxID=2291815 RepID=A0A3E1NMK6_9BACT|nr:DNA topoisomerase IB [Deminuibacter soli]RFM29142.1 DNA topoisomerase IB [Deminuibacter soli]
MSVVQLSHKEFLLMAHDNARAAKAAKLVYVNDAEPGISRLKKGKGFVYIYDNKPLRGKNEVERIRALAIPPAWTNVWICPLPNGHIQATGTDIRQRKQYRYHNLWSTLRNETKFHRMVEFGKALPALRLQLEQDMSQHALSETKVLATLISLMERTYIRIGNTGYEKANGSYGLTTLKDQHVKINGDSVMFSFKGKKGVYHEINLRNRRLARAVKNCRDIPGKELFQYYDENHQRQKVDSGMVNNYIKEISGCDFTAKDFRTWAGSLALLRQLKSVGEAQGVTARKHNIVQALDEVSKKLGNTRSVCKKYYVHPGIIQLYEEDALGAYLKQLDDIEVDDGQTGLTADEKVLMKLLNALC